jgi:RNA polymerase sigma factor (sigma-70 family)
VARVRAGDERAFELVFDRYHRSLLAFCRRMLASDEEAEDALQHTFMAAYRALRTSDRPILLKAWLYTIARNRCLSILRARREQVAFDDGHAASDGLAPTSIAAPSCADCWPTSSSYPRSSARRSCSSSWATTATTRSPRSSACGATR